MPSKDKKSLTCRPRIRVMADDQIALGPGKVDLLEAIEHTGSISRAAQGLGLSYRRAWTLVDTMNRCFKSVLVEGSAGGKQGGGAHLTPLGKQMAELYRTMEARTDTAIQKEWKIIKRSLKSPE
ncbi:MAG: LysR family transcriptional regulator [Nitrospinaceae bacterium]|nr:LysR family transcriptional regulator [Nitrospinaceae bacterium]